MNKKISVIIPIYNVEDYLKETIESIINQTIGFDNIELILINDGSTDNSEQICLEYKNKYPNNIIYKKQKNSGVSVARNEGIALASGKFISMPDGDDKWDLDVFEKAIDFFEKNKSINMVSFRVYQFDGVERFHPLDYKYDKNKIVNVMKEPTMVQTLVTSMIYRSEFLKKYKFDKEIGYSEDAKVLGTMFMDCYEYGIICDSKYYGRKRKNNSSATQTSTYKKNWYNKTILDCYYFLADESKKRYGKIIDVIQLTILYELQWRFFTDKEKISLNQEEIKEYYKLIVDLLKECSDKNIMLSPAANDYKRRKLLEIKHNGIIYDKFKIKSNFLYFNNTKIISIDDLYIKCENIYIKNNKLNLKLNFNIFVTNEFKILLETNSKKETIKSSKRLEDNKIFYNENDFYTDEFNIEIDIKDLKEISIYTKIDNRKIKLQVKFSSKILSDIEKYNCFVIQNKVIQCKDKTIFISNNLFKKYKIKLKKNISKTSRRFLNGK